MVGAQFAERYDIVGPLGSGGMAEVFLARDVRLDRKVALKLLHPAFACDPEFVERFRREAGAAARLSHPHAVHIYDCGYADGRHFIAMEYVEGHSLKDVIRAEAPLPPLRVIALAREVLSALDHAHQAGIVHRDVKPQNIIIDRTGRAKVADFGIARATGDGQMTETGAILGTALYLSPEQATGEPVTPASDLYSVGVMMYEMATGRPPFNGDNAIALGMMHVHRTPPPPRGLVPGLPEGLEAVILKALSKSPSDRYASAAEFIDALDALTATASLARTAAAPVVGREAPVEKTSIRPPAAAGGPAAAARPAVPRLAREPGTSEAPRPRRRLRTLVIVAVLVVLLGAAGGAAALVLDRVSTVPVPDLVGKTMAEALEAVSVQGLQLQEGGPAEDSTVVAEGGIVRQEPAFGGSMEKGRSVRVWLSAGPPPVSVPNLVGLTAEEAAQTLRGQELESTVVTVPRADREAGRVFAQEPAAGREVEMGSVVEVRVAVPPPTTTTTLPPTTTTTEPQEDPSTLDKIRDWFGSAFGGDDDEVDE